MCTSRDGRQGRRRPPATAVRRAARDAARAPMILPLVPLLGGRSSSPLLIWPVTRPGQLGTPLLSRHRGPPRLPCRQRRRRSGAGVAEAEAEAEAAMGGARPRRQRYASSLRGVAAHLIGLDDGRKRSPLQEASAYRVAAGVRLGPVELGDVAMYVLLRCDMSMMAELGGPQQLEDMPAKVARDVAANADGRRLDIDDGGRRTPSTPARSSQPARLTLAGPGRPASGASTSLPPRSRAAGRAAAEPGRAPPSRR